MLSRRFVWLLGVLTVSFAITLYFPKTVTAQSNQPRLIPLSGDNNPEPRILPIFPAQDFVIYGRAGATVDEAVYPNFVKPTDPNPKLLDRARTDVGIVAGVEYRPIPHALDPERLVHPSNIGFLGPENLQRMPDLETFFNFSGTVELLTTDITLARYDIVISEIMWGVDQGLRDKTGTIQVEKVDASGNRILDNQGAVQFVDVPVPLLLSQEVQWFEFYNTTTEDITADLYLLFTPFVSYPDQDSVEIGGTTYKVLDAVSTLFGGRWELPGKSGRRPSTAFVSAYRIIDYDTVEDSELTRNEQLAGIPFGSYEDNWEKTPDEGRRNTVLTIIVGSNLVNLPYVATPGAKHVPERYTKSLKTTTTSSNKVVINEVRNDTSRANIDWIELKNVSSRTVDLEDWELTIVTDVDEDDDLVDLPPYELAKGEILLILNEYPSSTELAEGIDIEAPEEHRRLGGLTHKYFVSEDLDLPADKKFVLLLRSEYDQNGKDEAIEDYAGNGFFSDGFTRFWPRLAQRLPINVEDFGDASFASKSQAWARIRYEKDDGHHEEAWNIVEAQGGLGYVPGVDLNYAPGTPGYENTAIKTQLENKKFSVPNEIEYDDGDISISEIMYDPGPNQNRVQWIELYNSSKTQAINLEDWEFEIRNLDDEERTYINGSFAFQEVVILPNQALLLVSKNKGTNVPSNRVYDLYRNHRRELELARWPNRLLNPNGFHLKLTDKADPERDGDDLIVDEVGNLKFESGERGKAWDLPEINPERRRSLVRLYGGRFKPDKGRRDGKPNSPDAGMKAESWRRFPTNGISMSYYGSHSDLGSPGYRLGGPLPVVLSSFRPVRMETGEVLIKWRTASELNNAGFNILRSERREGDFTVINVKGIIRGHGTSSEQHLYFYTDTTAKPDVVYYYRIEDVSFDGMRQTLATVRLKGEVSAAGKFTTIWGRLKAQE